MEVNSMPESKQPSVKAASVQHNTTAVASSAAQTAAKPEAPARKTAQKTVAATSKKKVARKKAATSTKKASAGKKTVSADAASVAVSSPVSSEGSRAASAAAKPALSREARQRMIGEAAYLISLKRHAGLAGPEADWLYAETVIDLVFATED
jgi:hypothetical protein